MQRLPLLFLILVPLALSAREKDLDLRESGPPAAEELIVKGWADESPVFQTQDPQTPVPFRTLYGKVTDSRSGDPIPYASIKLEGGTLSNVTNAEGFFSLKVPEDLPDDTRISLSHLGYLNASCVIAAFRDRTADRPLQINMTPVSIQLDPSIIRDIDPLELLKTAYRHVRDNYPQQHEYLVAFYREMIRKGTAKYLVLNEAVIDIDKAPYSYGFSNDRAAIYKGRGSKNFVAADTLFVQFQGGIAGTLAGDIVKDPFVGVYLEQVPDYYDLSIEGSATLDDRECLILRFSEKERQEPAMFDGRLYIDSETYAIARAEYWMNVKGREEKAASRFVVKKPADFRFGVEKAHYRLYFKKQAGRWHFDYSRLELQFTARRKRTLFRHTYTIISEMAVTDLRPEEFKITNQDKVKFNDILSNQVSDFSDPEFWGSYNIIEPDQSIEHAIRRIIRQLKARQ